MQPLTNLIAKETKEATPTVVRLCPFTLQVCVQSLHIEGNLRYSVHVEGV